MIADLPYCVAQAAEQYGVPPALIRSVLDVEGGGYGVDSKNRDGSDDMGWMQINSRWLPTFAPYAITRERLLTDACLNLEVGSWILRHYYLRERDWNRAIRSYNTGSGQRGAVYAYRVIVRWHLHENDPVTVQLNFTERNSNGEASQSAEQGKLGDVQLPFALISSR